MYGTFPETYSEFLPYDLFDALFYPKGQKLDFAVDAPDNEELWRLTNCVLGFFYIPH